MNKKYGLAALAAGIAVALWVGADSHEAPILSKAVPEAAASTQASFARVPMAFERNVGQTDAEVLFLARGPGYGLFLTSTEAVLSLPSSPRATGSPARAGQPTVVRMSLLGANPEPAVEGNGLQEGKSHYYQGAAPADWQRDVARYGRVRYREVYPGIDLVYYGKQQQLEYDFIVSPGRDPEEIAVQFNGIDSMRLDGKGNLLLGTAAGDLIQHKPVLYQEVDGKRRAVDGRYRLLGGNRIGFEVASYDTSRPLVIDPVIGYASYFGGSGDDGISALATDAAGNLYAVGTTASLNFPLRNAPQATNRGSGDVFITRFNSDGNGLVYSTYLGGGNADRGTAVAVDRAGNAYVTGYTRSTNFPVASALQAAHGADGGVEDAFVARLDGAGALAFSTYLGGAGADTGSAIDLDRSGNIYVAGATASANFPQASAMDASLGGSRDGFLARLTPSGNALVFSTYFGGAGIDQINGMAIDRAPSRAGAIYLTGETTSTDLPVSGNAVQASLKGGSDSFVSVLNPSASAPYIGLQFGTYLGSANADVGEDIDVDADGNAVMVGRTLATSSAPFPTANARQATPAGASDGFVTKVSLGATPALAYSTYLGGSGEDLLEGVAIDAFGTAYVIGTTSSTNLIGTSPYYGLQSANGGGIDAMAGRYSDEGELFWASYLGGSGNEQGTAIALYGSSSIFVGGSTTSTNLKTLLPFKSSNSGGADAFVTRYGVRSMRTNARNFNADKTDDILWRNASSGANVIWRSANSTTTTPVTTQSPSQWRLAGTGDFDGDLRADIVWRNIVTGANVRWVSGLSNSQVSFQSVTNQQWQVAGVGDFNLDGRSDIFWRNGSTGSNAIWLTGNYATQKPVTGVTNTAWRVAGIGDFNGDFESDILWRNTSTGGNGIWLSGDSATQQPVTAVTNQAWQVAGIGDFLGDGKSDILWRNSSTGQVVIWREGSYASQEQPVTVSLDYEVAAVGDYNGDGRSDILWRNKRNGTNVMWRSGNIGNWQSVTAVTNQGWRVVP